MNHEISSPHRPGFLAISIFLALLAVPASAQDRTTRPSIGPAIAEVSKNQIVVPSVEGRLDAASIRVNARQPVNFVAFEMLDPATKRPISPDTMLTLPNGKSLTAREYYSQLNQLEQGFNRIGYSLRVETLPDNPANSARLIVASGTQDLMNLQQVVVDNLLLQNQSKVISTAHLPFNPGTMVLPMTTETLKRAQMADVNDYPLRLRAFNGVFPPVSKTKVNETRSWNYPLGNPATFSAYINGKITLTADASVQDIVGEANAGGSIFNNSRDLLRATGSVHAPANGTDMTTKLNISVLGTTVFNLDKHFNSTTATPLWTESGAVGPKSLDFSTTIHFSLGPVPMSVKVGAQGSAGLTYNLSVFPTSVKAQAVPSVHSNGYVQAAVDIVVARAGAGASLVLLNDDLDLGGEVAIKFDEPLKGPYFMVKYYGNNNLEMLNGRVYAFACVYVPRWGVPPWKEVCYNTDLFNWSGYKINGYLFNEQKKFYLF